MFQIGLEIVESNARYGIVISREFFSLIWSNLVSEAYSFNKTVLSEFDLD